MSELINTLLRNGADTVRRVWHLEDIQMRPEHIQAVMCELCNRMDKAADHIEKLEAENARLREALHPFADAADEADDCGFDDSNQAPVDVGDCRAAHQALEKQNDTD